MPIDPLDPSRPVLADPVQITEELRAIKSRLVADLAAITSLQSTVVAITDPGAFGLPFLGTDTLAEAMVLLNQGAAGKVVFEATTLGAIQTYLDIVSPNATVATGAGKSCITLPGGVKINMITGDFTDTSPVIWHTAFSTTILGIACTSLFNANNTFQVYNENNSGCNVSFEGGGSRRGSVIAIGI